MYHHGFVCTGICFSPRSSWLELRHLWRIAVRSGEAQTPLIGKANGIVPHHVVYEIVTPKHSHTASCTASSVQANRDCNYPYCCRGKELATGTKVGMKIYTWCEILLA